MPAAEVYIPEGSLTPGAEKTLLRRLTDVLIEAEGLSTANTITRSVSKILVHRPVLYVGGVPSEVPHYYFFAMMPEGQLDLARWKVAVENVTNAFLDAEEGIRPREPGRIWAFVTEVPEGTWGALGKLRTLADMLTLASQDAASSQRLASSRIQARRKAMATTLLATNTEPTS